MVDYNFVGSDNASEVQLFEAKINPKATTGNELPVPISNYAVMSSIGRKLEVYLRALHSIAASMRCLKVGEVLRRRLGGGVSKFTPLTHRMNLINHE